MPAPETAPCPRCGAPRSAGGDCPRCLLELGLAPGTKDAPPPPPAGPSASPSEGPVPEPPTLEEVRAAFPDLEIETLLGRGGMGAVFRARQPRLDRWVALKVLPRALGRQAGFAERFAREARALARLSHPGIVAVHDFGNAAGLSYLVMELVDGVNLRELLRQGPLEPARALAIARELCEALQFAHDEGVVHRDIKPENVLIDARGRVKVADFGLAKLTGAVGDPLLTRSDQVMGTPHYMAPEQLERPAEVDHRADLFALGVVLYEMLTGGLPRGHFEPPSQRVHVDVKLDEIVIKALQREPARRYQHALEIRTDVDGVPREAAVPSSEAPREPGAVPSRLAPTGWKVGLLFLVLWLLVGAAWNLGLVALVLACALAIAATGWALRERVRTVPGWSERLEDEPRARRIERRVGFVAGSALALGAIVLGHLAHWEEGVRTWTPHARGAQGVSQYWRQNPWNLLRLSTDEGELSARLDGAEPRVATERSFTSVFFPLGGLPPLALILGGFGLLATGLALGVHRRGAPPEERRHGWHVAGELASWSLGALVTLWIAGPLGALLRHDVRQEVSAARRASTDLGATTAGLERVLTGLGLAVDVHEELNVVDARSGRALGRAIVLRAEAASPLDHWRTSLAGPRRVSPQVWATLIERTDGTTEVELRLGTYDPRSREHDEAVAFAQRMAEALRTPAPAPMEVRRQ